MAGGSPPASPVIQYSCGRHKRVPSNLLLRDRQCLTLHPMIWRSWAPAFAGWRMRWRARGGGSGSLSLIATRRRTAPRCAISDSSRCPGNSRAPCGSGHGAAAKSGPRLQPRPASRWSIAAPGSSRAGRNPWRCWKRSCGPEWPADAGCWLRRRQGGVVQNCWPRSSWQFSRARWNCASSLETRYRGSHSGSPPTLERWVGTYASSPDGPVLFDAPSARVRIAIVTSGSGASTGFAIGEELIESLFGTA